MGTSIVVLILFPGVNKLACKGYANREKRAGIERNDRTFSSINFFIKQNEALREYAGDFAR